MKNSNDEDLKWMRAALRQAAAAERREEVPVGSVVVLNGEIIGRGYNLRETSHDPTSHAEIRAIRQATRRLGDWRLDGATIYITLEPCLMCMGAIKNARISRLVFGASDPKQGASKLATRARAAKDGNDKPLEVCGGVLADEASVQLKNFFRHRRSKARRS
ncbi:MAG: tRNA adenosine(34) deaminase TadA [Chrysiogenetes bacterium]|nr:tRNA adenosine(34) deaminase TadA [Chrysiogenetes bacterium]